MFKLNGTSYDESKLTQQGAKLLGLLQQAQQELNQIEIRKELTQAAQQGLIDQLKPLLPEPAPTTSLPLQKATGQASEKIPTTPAEMPKEAPACFPVNIPSEILEKP